MSPQQPLSPASTCLSGHLLAAPCRISTRNPANNHAHDCSRSTQGCTKNLTLLTYSRLERVAFRDRNLQGRSCRAGKASRVPPISMAGNLSRTLDQTPPPPASKLPSWNASRLSHSSSRSTCILRIDYSHVVGFWHLLSE